MIFVAKDTLAQSVVAKYVTSTGVTVLVQQEPATDLVALCVFVKAGSAEEDGIYGIGSVTARSMLGGNTNQSREAVLRGIRDAGGSLNISWNPDYTLFTCVTSEQGFSDGFYVLAQALKGAEFDADMVFRAKQEVINETAQEFSDPFRLAYSTARSKLYPDYPYRTPFGTTADSSRKLTASAVQSYYRKHFTPRNTVIVVVGNISLERVKKSVDAHLIDYERPEPRSQRPANALFHAEAGRVSRHVGGHTRLVVAAYRGPGISDSDYPTWLVLDGMLGGGKSSRLFRTVRDQGGVGYAVGSRANSLAKAGNILAYLEYDPNRTTADGKPIDHTANEKLLTDTVASINSSPPSQAELDRAKRFVAGAYLLGHQRVRERAFYYGWYESVGPGYLFDSDLPEKMKAVTISDIKRVAQKYLGEPVLIVIQ